MRVLSFDPGERNCGWAVLEKGPTYIDSGVLRHHRPSDVSYQQHRMRVTHDIRTSVLALIQKYRPTIIVVEIVPSHGSEGFIKAGQSYLANVVATTIHNVAIQQGIEVRQVAARSWQAVIAKRGKTAKITKPQIRNGCLERLPQLRTELAAELQKWDRWDAIGIATFALDSFAHPDSNSCEKHL